MDTGTAMNPGIRAFFIHFFSTVFFILVSLAYFYPVIQGKAIFQSDIIQYTGMAKEQNDFRKSTGEEPYWTNSAFGGMPTYQLGANYPNDLVKDLDRTLRFLPRPADYLFLYLLGFYILLSCLKVDYRLAILGALAFGFSTYLIIILGVGHNAKAHAIAYLPVVLGGIVLAFRRKYIWGFLLTAIGMALEVNANHYQMTYYFMLLVLVLGLVYLVAAIRRKQLKHYFMAVGTLILAVCLGIATNATGLMATKQYADWSTRGSSELTLDPEGNPKEDRKGLDKEYITQYSYGIAESLNIFIPRLFGGSNSEDMGEDSKTYDFLVEKGITRTRALEFTSGLPLYWGDQPGVAAPAYIGAVIFFLFILGLFLVRGYAKWWLLGGFLLSLILSWGKNLGVVTDFMIDYFPLYNKFRAVSSIQVILELCAPILGILALATWYNRACSSRVKFKALRNSFIIVAGLGVAVLLLRSVFDFTGLNDETYRKFFGEEILSMIRRDREMVYFQDTIRSLLFVLGTALILYFNMKGKLKQTVSIVLLGGLVLFDLVGVDKRYVNAEDFVRQRTMREPFQALNVDKQILSDTTHFRVYDVSEGLNGARTSYLHNSIGGYHAAKPAGIQDLFDYHVYRNNPEVLNMLNVKYIMQQDEQGKRYASLNPDANGNAWFIAALKTVVNSDEEIRELSNIDTKTTAILNTSLDYRIDQMEYAVDSTSRITLSDYKPNHLTYISSNENPGLAVFSEMYYPFGWNAYIDGEESEHFRVNYVLRALQVPAGRHVIEFKFQPEVVRKGSTIALASSLVLAVLLILAVISSFVSQRKKKDSG